MSILHLMHGRLPWEICMGDWEHGRLSEHWDQGSGIPVTCATPHLKRFLQDKSSALYRYFDQKVKEFEAGLPRSAGERCSLSG